MTINLDRKKNAIYEFFKTSDELLCYVIQRVK